MLFEQISGNLNLELESMHIVLYFRLSVTTKYLHCLVKRQKTRVGEANSWGLELYQTVL